MAGTFAYPLLAGPPGMLGSGVEVRDYNSAVAAVKQIPVFMCHPEAQLCCISEPLKNVMLGFMENKAVCDGQCQVK